MLKRIKINSILSRIYSLFVLQNKTAMALKQIPLKKRPVDIALVIFFIINFIFITYMIDIEQLVIADASSFQYPVWPPRWLVDLVHWYGKNFDPVLMARPAWWRATIWIDSLFFGPFYLVAIYAFIKRKELDPLRRHHLGMVMIIT